MQSDCDRVICAIVIALAPDLSSHARRLSEESERLVDKVRSKVEQNAAFVRLFLPGAGGLAGPPAVEGRLKMDQPA